MQQFMGKKHCSTFKRCTTTIFNFSIADSIPRSIIINISNSPLTCLGKPNNPTRNDLCYGRRKITIKITYCQF